MKKPLVILILLASAGMTVGMPSFNMDYAVFRSEGNYLLQVYVMIQRNSLNHKLQGNEYIADYNFLVEIKRADSVLTSVVYERTDKAAALTDITGTQKIPDECAFHIKPGTFNIEVTITDLKDGSNRKRAVEIAIPDFPQDKLSLSDIELATKVERAAQSGRFVKNRLLVIPNADAMFGGDISTAYYYMEIYNLCTDIQGKEYSVKRTILDENKEPIKNLPEKVKPQTASSVVEADLFSCATLGTGAYFLRIEIVDGCNSKKAVKEKKFWVVKSGETLAIQPSFSYGKLEDSIKKMTRDEMKIEIDFIRYLTSRSENKVINDLKPEGYQVFLTNFWRNRDSSGEMRMKYLTRVNSANDKYRTPFTEGWKTDRGRALIIYGAPDMVERRNFQLGSQDSEVWYYDNLEGGTLFLFCDLKGTGDFQQVYSTKRGEYIDAGWVREVEEREPGLLQDIRNH